VAIVTGTNLEGTMKRWLTNAMYAKMAQVYKDAFRQRRYRRGVHRAYAKLGVVPAHPRTRGVMPRSPLVTKHTGRTIAWRSLR
jgi:hypothetical protein